MRPSGDHASVFGAALSRRGFVGAGGALAVYLGLAPKIMAQAAASGRATLDPASPESWIEIHRDNTVTLRTGKCDFGQSTIYTAYPQIVAEELGVPFEAITRIVSGDTDRTPDGGITAGLLRQGQNLRKAAAYTREAIIAIAAQRLGVPREQLTVANGVVSAGARSLSYGDIVSGQDFRLVIPVQGDLTSLMGLTVVGDPPLKPVSAYSIVGQPLKNRATAAKVAVKESWAADVRLPGMLHARVIHPPTFGSTLVAAGAVDLDRHPGARVVREGNLLAVVSADEWEAIQAARHVAGATTWTAWKGLPGHDKLFDHLRDKTDWNALPVARGAANAGDVAGGLARAARTLTATYAMPYMKHAPIGPSVAVADYGKDGSVVVHTSSQNPQALRKAIATMLGAPLDKVVVRSYAGSGHYGRSNGGNSGAEDEAVLLSRAVGRPVRVQWMRPEDFQWSTQAPPSSVDVRIGLDANGRMIAYEARHHSLPMQDDRLIGALLAGLPTIGKPDMAAPEFVNRADVRMADRWLYAGVPNVDEQSFSSGQIGQAGSPLSVGLRDHSMRTPIQFQQNFPREMAISDAAVLAGADALQFRIDHAQDKRVRDVLARLRAESGWTTRPSPSPQARANGDGPTQGRGVSVMLRDNGYWACAAEVSVFPATGQVKVDRVTLVVDTGIVINPLQLRRQAQAGCLMGVGQTLHEEVTFSESAVTIGDWSGYPILTMDEMPELKIVLAPSEGATTYGQGSESANALAAPAIASAVFDATGRHIRRLPLTSDYVKAALDA